MNQVWLKLKDVFEKYPQYFPPEKINRNDFMVCYKFVMTRCFGWSLPSTSMVPFADMLNHGIEAATHYMVNEYYELNE